MTTWHCLEPDCTAGDTGTDWARLDRDAEAHVKKAGHSTMCSTVGGGK